MIPRRQVTYRGVTLEEMDTDAVIARRPDVALVDELAHTNAPGSKHEKRWQDIEEIRDHGITVISTLNVQHLESLNDLVENITGVRVRETVPDWVVDDADEIELVDTSPEALRARLRHGNIYPPAQAQTAAENFFTLENLAALRSLALQRTQQEVEQQVAQYMRDLGKDKLPAGEQVVVAVDHRPHSRALLRRGWRIASGVHAELTAAVVDTGDRLEQPQQRDLETNLRLAEDLGARVVRLSGRDPATALAAYARAEHVTHLVVGHVNRPRWQTLLREPFTERLFRLLPDLAIHVVPERAGPGH